MAPSTKPNPFFRPNKPPLSSTPIDSSDPFEPLPPSSSARASPAPPPPPPPRVLAVDIAPNVLRPVAFRVFTKKHNLTLKSDALTVLCGFVGRRCGAEWRDTGSGEKVLDEIARQWKRNEGPGKILVDGGEALRGILRGLEVPGGAGGGGGGAGGMRRESSFDIGAVPPSSALVGGVVADAEDARAEEGADGQALDPREYLRIVDAFEMPKWMYNPLKKQFERGAKPSVLAPASSKTALARNRYHILHQRLLRNETFLPTSYPKPHAARHAAHKLTPLSALLGRAGQSFLLFGLLSTSPSGTPSLHDPTGEIQLDLALARAVPHDAAWFCPGAYCIVDGVYEEDGRFTVFTIAQPPPERRDATAEVFGHVDFLGTGVSLDMSAPTTGGGGGQQGHAMRRVERALAGVRWVVAGELALDQPATLAGLRQLFETYARAPPLLFVLLGNFAAAPPHAGTRATAAYKEGFDALAGVLEDFPAVADRSSFLFVPGDHDPWASTFSGGAASAWPQRAVPEGFTNRVKRALRKGGGEARWASNPCRVGYFTSEVVVCRDDVLGRLQRCSVRFEAGEEGKEREREMDVDVDVDGEAAAAATATAEEDADEEGRRREEGGGDHVPVDADVRTARKLVKTVLDQANLSPFPLATRPVLWDYAHAVSLYPLPTALILCEPAAQPFALTYEGCHVMNPGRLVQRKRIRWIEYAPAERRGQVMEAGF